MNETQTREVVRLTEAPNPALAHIWEEALLDEGIECRVVGDYLNAGLGDIGSLRPEIWVHEDDLERAREIIAEHEREAAQHRDEEASGAQRMLRSREQTRGFYNKISSFYDSLSDVAEEPIRRAALELLDPQPEERILEIGFGTGRCLVSLARAVGPEGKVSGLDLSEGMIKVAGENLAVSGLTQAVQLQRGDATELPYADGSMDAILMTFTLELFEPGEREKVLKECQRVLGLGGRIVVAGLSKEGEDGILVRAYEWGHQHFPNFLDCRPIRVGQVLANAGFQVSRVERRNIGLPVEIVQADKAQGE